MSTGIGIRIWDASGNLLLDETDVVTVFIDAIHVTGPGSVSNDLLNTGTPVWFFQTINPGLYGTPIVTFSGTTMSWANNSNGISYDGLLYYGVQ